MKIQRAKFVGVSGVPDMTLDLTEGRTGVPHSLVAITGPAASGKTRTIEALIAAKEAIRPYGLLANGAGFIRGAGTSAKVYVTFYLDEAERDFAGTSSPTLEGEIIFHPDRVVAEADDGLRAVLGRYAHNPAHGKVDYFPMERRIPMFPPFGGLGAGEQRPGRLTKDQRKYGFVLPLLRSFEHDAARRDRFVAALEALSPTCRYVADTSSETIPRCFTSRGGDPVTVGQLSHAEADAVIFAATAAAISLDHSLVFIDRPDLYVDDLDAFLDGLLSLGKDNQLFCTGGARLATAAARRAHVVALKS